ncbi:hypothetical protein G9A89_022475 [Geosiphon pyriformis]|nr:hypothetical protein G9A89_022475 [Geosiphon pyriformis]
MTDFGLTDGYYVHDGLDQGEVFFPLLWCISYNSLLCEVKRQDSVYGYRLNSHFISKTGWADPQAGLSSFLAASAFVDDTIWVGSSQAVTQHILDVASEFFRFNNISVNNDKTVAIPINCRVLDPHLTISSDALVCRILKSKSGLPHDFPNNALHYPSLYGLKTFEQIQAESKLASTVTFANSAGILGHLFSYKSYDLQVFSWHPRHPLLFLSHIGVNLSNNFLTGVVCIFSGCDLSLDGSLACAFRCQCGTPMSLVLGEPCFFKCVSSLRHYGIAFVEQLCDRDGNVFSWGTFKHWKRLDPCGSIPFWFDLSIHFLGGIVPLFSSFSLLNGYAVSDVCLSHAFGIVCDTLLTIDAACLSVYTDGSLFSLGTINVKTGAAVFFEDIDLGLGVGMSGLVSFIITELQAIALALECIPSSRSINLFLDSQATLDAFKVKSHSGVSSNEHADALAKDTTLSAWHLSHLVSKHFLCAGGAAVSGNSKHFVHDVFRSVNHARWEVGVGSCIVTASLHADINWFKSSLPLVSPACTWQAHLYNRRYPSVVCLFCGNVEISDHVFSCSHDAANCAHLLDAYALTWEALSGLSHFFLCVLQMLASCISEVGIGVALCKGFVFDNWFHESVSVFKDSKKGTKKIVSFVREFCLAFRDDIWLVCAKYWAFMERHSLIPRDGFIPASISSLSSAFSAGVIRLLGVAKAFGVSFEFRKLYSFFSGIGNTVSVHIGV